MGGKTNVIKEPWTDPFEGVEFEIFGQSATREIMFAFLARDKKTALTPEDLKEQARNLRFLCGRIEFLLSQWDPKKQRYWEVLSVIDREIHRNNYSTREIRARADQAARDRRDEARPKWGVERKVS